MVPLLRLLAPPQVAVELLLRLPHRAVDPLERRAGLVAAPVGARHREQLERPDLPGGGHVRSLAQVDERPVLVDRRRRHGRPVALGLRGQVVEDLDLVGLVALGEERPPLLRRQLAAHERVVGLDRLRHALLDRREVLGRERPWQVEVVVEAVLDRRPDAELRAREQVEHRLGHHVRRGMAHRVELAVRAGIEQLVGRPAFGRDELLLDLLGLRDRHVLLGHPSRLHESRNLSSSTGREAHWRSRGSTRLRGSHLRAALSCRANGRTRAGSPAAHGWYLARGRRRASSRGPVLW